MGFGINLNYLAKKQSFSANGRWRYFCNDNEEMKYEREPF